MSITDNICAVRENIARAAERSGRTADDITLVAVTKYVGTPEIREVLANGIYDIGENRVQDILKKREELADGRIRWSFTGQLQLNKVKYIVKDISLVQSLDRLELARELDRRAEKAMVRVPALIEVNIAKQDTKTGVYEEELFGFAETLSEFAHIEVRGLMAIMPYESSETLRPYFAAMRSLFDRLSARNISGIRMDCLSMGMTNDYETAVAEGATMVRIGRALFR